MLYQPEHESTKPVEAMSLVELAGEYGRTLDQFEHMDAMKACGRLPEEFEYEYERIKERRRVLRTALYRGSRTPHKSEPPLPPLDWK